MPGDLTVRRVNASEMEPLIPALCEVLIDCVDGGASVSFMAPLPWGRAEAFWRDVHVRVAAVETEILIAECDRVVAGTVQVIVAQPENQPHRADIAKMRVRRRFRKRGVGGALMRAAEDHALALGKTLLVLDTATGGDAERLYRRLGWTEVGCIPGYALYPDGGPCDTTVFYRQLEVAPAVSATLSP